MDRQSFDDGLIAAAVVVVLVWFFFMSAFRSEKAKAVDKP